MILKPREKRCRNTSPSFSNTIAKTADDTDYKTVLIFTNTEKINNFVNDQLATEYDGYTNPIPTGYSKTSKRSYGIMAR